MFNTTAYLVELRDNRERIAYEVANNPHGWSYRVVARVLVDADEFRTDDEPAAEVAPKTIADSFAEFAQSYANAPLILGSYAGASENQARYLAMLDWQLGERRLFVGQLHKRDAGPMITMALGRLSVTAG